MLAMSRLQLFGTGNQPVMYDCPDGQTWDTISNQCIATSADSGEPGFFDKLTAAASAAYDSTANAASSWWTSTSSAPAPSTNACPQGTLPMALYNVNGTAMGQMACGTIGAKNPCPSGFAVSGEQQCTRLPDVPWYKNWKVWAGVGGAVAGVVVIHKLTK